MSAEDLTCIDDWDILNYYLMTLCLLAFDELKTGILNQLYSLFLLIITIEYGRQLIQGKPSPEYLDLFIDRPRVVVPMSKV